MKKQLQPLEEYVTIRIPRSKLTGRPSKKPPLDELLAYYSEHTRAETAVHYKVSPSTVSVWLRQGGIKKYAKQI